MVRKIFTLLTSSRGTKAMNIIKTISAAMVALFLISTGTANAGNCAAKAGAVAAQNGGRVLAVSAFKQGNATMCRITVLVKSANGGPPRKKTVVVRG